MKTNKIFSIFAALQLSILAFFQPVPALAYDFSTIVSGANGSGSFAKFSGNKVIYYDTNSNLKVINTETQQYAYSLSAAQLGITGKDYISISGSKAAFIGYEEGNSQNPYVVNIVDLSIPAPPNPVVCGQANGELDLDGNDLVYSQQGGWGPVYLTDVTSPAGMCDSNYAHLVDGDGMSTQIRYPKISGNNVVYIKGDQVWYANVSNPSSITPVQITNTQTVKTALDIEGNDIFWMEGWPSYQVFRRTIGGSNEEISSQTCGEECLLPEYTISVDNRRATWADGTNVYLYDLRKGTQETVLANSQSMVSNPNLDGNNLVLVQGTNLKGTTVLDYTPIYRLYNTLNGAYLYTRGEADKQHVMSTWPEFEYTDGVPAFYASLDEANGLTPMYRLYNTKNGAYLYTRGFDDMIHVISTWPEFEFTDGVPAFYASLSSQQGLTPIYRLYNTLNGMYLYTRGSADMLHVISTWPEFEFTDGIPAFYAALN